MRFRHAASKWAERRARSSAGPVARCRCSVLLFVAKSCPTSWSDMTLLPGDALRMRAGARCVRSMAGRDSTNRLREGTVGAPPDGIDYVDALPGCCQRPRRGGRSRPSRFGHLRRCVFGAAGTYLALACMVSNIIRLLRMWAINCVLGRTWLNGTPDDRGVLAAVAGGCRAGVDPVPDRGCGTRRRRGGGRCTGGIATFASTTTTGCGRRKALRTC